MQKIKYTYFDRMITADLSRIEERFLFLLAKICDESGCATGIYYKSITKLLECDDSTFYEIRDRLTEKNFIKWEKNHAADIDIKMVGNSFMVMGEDGIIKPVYSDYVDININIFQDPEFYKCRAGAIKMAMVFVKRVAANGAITETNSIAADKKSAEEKRKLWYLPFNEHKKMAGLLQVKTRMIKDYLKELQPWISVANKIEKEGKAYDIITVKKKSLERPIYETTKRGKRAIEKVYADRYWYMYFIKTYCRRNKIEENDISLSDTADLIKQYRDEARKKGLNIMHLICKAIRNVASSILNSINVHKALRGLLYQTI